MSIDWYPGHMVKARRDAAETMAKTDVVIEVLDARVPRASLNPLVETLRLKHQRPALKILNKADIADTARTKLWLAHYNAMPGVKAIAVSSKKQGDVVRIPNECAALIEGTRTRPARLMILGIPNVGKSTLMNALLKKHVANVGDEPAITKGQMRHQLPNGMTLTDTPGMLWPGVEQDAAYKLASTGSIGRNAYDEIEVAEYLGVYLRAEYPAMLKKRYGDLPEEQITAGIARVRSFVLKGGVPDLEKAALTLLNDFRSATLGAITLEIP